MTALYEITESLKELSDLSEVPDMAVAVRDTLEAVEGEFNDKAVSVAHFIRNLDSDVEAIDNEVKRLNDRKKALKTKQESIKDYLRENMEATGIKKIECPLFSISCVAGRDVVTINDEAALPDDYVEVKSEVKPVKATILKALKEGVEVPGASISKSKSSIRIK